MDFSHAASELVVDQLQLIQQQADGVVLPDELDVDSAREVCTLAIACANVLKPRARFAAKKKAAMKSAGELDDALDLLDAARPLVLSLKGLVMECQGRIREGRWTPWTPRERATVMSEISKALKEIDELELLFAIVRRGR